MINPLLDINKYKDIYNSKKIVVIKDFLSQDIAGKIYKYLHFQKKRKVGCTVTVMIIKRVIYKIKILK